ncbi:MAG: MarR family winged helix-turn-helix transcriptional regulator [Alphaproteobacteria bacterium]|nr:MarR family winged helix-turn-helix transcriptional regulator [Alphaproteobacteria bacterium]
MPDQKSSVPAGAAAPDYRLEEQAGHLFRRVHQRATAIFLNKIGEPQLTPTQWAALVKLRDTRGASQNHLGRLTAMDPATIQGVIRRLVDRDLIERAGDPQDRRRQVLRLTPAGAALVDRLSANALEVSRAILEPLTPTDRAEFLRMVKALV